MGKELIALGMETRGLGLAGLALTVAKDATFYADIKTRNTTGAAVTKDFLACFGVYDAAKGTFTVYFYSLRTGVSVATGDATNTLTCTAKEIGTWDALGAIGVYDAAAGVFTIESAVLLEDALTVSGVAVIGMTLRK